MTDGWIRIGRVPFRRRMLFTGSGASLFLLLYPALVLGPQLGGILLPDSAGWIDAVIGAGCGALLSCGALAVAALLSPGMHVSADGARIRIRGRVGAASDLHQASLLTDRAFGPRRNLLLQLHTEGRSARIWLRAGTRVLLSDEERTALAGALERSTIEPPRTSYDPSGRFARYNFPGSLTRDEAVRLVQRIPGPGEPLPISD